MDRTVIEEYAAGAARLSKSIAGLTPKEMHALPVPGTWSIQTITLHLMDSDLIGSDRMKRIIAMEDPLIVAYDENLFTKNLHYQDQDAALAASVFEQNRLLTAAILRQLPDEAFERTGRHTERGAVTLGGLVKDYVGHLAHHLKFLHEKRRLLGKPL